MSLLAIIATAAVLWMAVLVVALALCTVAGNADRALESHRRNRTAGNTRRR